MRLVTKRGAPQHSGVHRARRQDNFKSCYVITNMTLEDVRKAVSSRPKSAPTCTWFTLGDDSSELLSSNLTPTQVHNLPPPTRTAKSTKPLPHYKVHRTRKGTSPRTTRMPCEVARTPYTSISSEPNSSNTISNDFHYPI